MQASSATRRSGLPLASARYLTANWSVAPSRNRCSLLVILDLGGTAIKEAKVGKGKRMLRALGITLAASAIFTLMSLVRRGDAYALGQLIGVFLMAGVALSVWSVLAKRHWSWWGYIGRFLLCVLAVATIISMGNQSTTP